MFAVKPRAYGAGPAGATEDAGEEEGFLTGRVQPSDVRSCRPDGVGTMEALSVNPLDIRRTAQPTVWTRVFRRNGTQTKCASLRAVLRFRTRHTAGGAGGGRAPAPGARGRGCGPLCSLISENSGLRCAIPACTNRFADVTILYVTHTYSNEMFACLVI